MPASAAIGAILTRGQVESATVATLNTWLGTYLSEVERQIGQTEGAIQRPAAIYGSLDDRQGETENTPAVIVIAQPSGESYRQGNGDLNEWYRIRVEAVCVAGNEDDARYLADAYGAAIRAAVMQSWSQSDPAGGLSSIVSDLVVRIPPRSDLWDAEATRLMATGTVDFDAFCCSTVAGSVGGLGVLTAPVTDFEAVPDPTTVATTDVVFVGESADGSTTETNPG